MLGQTQSRIFLNIAEGKIVKRVDQRVEVYDYLEGDLERIYPKERVFRGETVPYWYLDMRDPQSETVLPGYPCHLRSMEVSYPLFGVYR